MARGRKPRYNDEKKQEIISFLKDNPGRGNMSRAKDAFGISFVTLRKIAAEAGIAAEAKGEGRGKKAVGRPAGAASKGGASKRAAKGAAKGGARRGRKPGSAKASASAASASTSSGSKADMIEQALDQLDLIKSQLQSYRKLVQALEG